MDFVKRNSSAIIIGDKECKYQFPDMFKNLIPNLIIPYVQIDEFEIMNVSKKNLRLHSKSTNTLIYNLEKLNLIAELEFKSLDRVGIYIACERHNLDGELPDFHRDAKEVNYFELMREKYNPTYVIRNEAGIIPGHLSIYFNLNGPSYTCTSGSHNHLLDKASWDLELGYIDMAIIGIVNLYDDPFKLLSANINKNSTLQREFVAVGIISSKTKEIDKNEFIDLTKDFVSWR